HPRRAVLPGRARDGVGSAGVGGAGIGRAGSARTDPGGACLPSRPRVRATGSEARRPRRAHRAAFMKERLTLALPKGRLLAAALRLLAEVGVDGVDAAARRLIFTDPARGLRLLFLKPADVPAYVTYGAADLGIVGKDILLEQEPDVYEPL